MSSSIYRGKLHTNAEIKGPFTEAHDEFRPKPINVLVESAHDDEKADISVFERDGEATVMFSFGGIWLTIDANGIVEIGEGGA